jgi:hypothetical protein
VGQIFAEVLASADPDARLTRHIVAERTIETVILRGWEGEWLG